MAFSMSAKTSRTTHFFNLSDWGGSEARVRFGYIRVPSSFRSGNGPVWVVRMYTGQSTITHHTRFTTHDTHEYTTQMMTHHSNPVWAVRMYTCLSTITHHTRLTTHDTRDTHGTHHVASWRSGNSPVWGSTHVHMSEYHHTLYPPYYLCRVCQVSNV